jgi:hypothetical protein
MRYGRSIAHYWGIIFSLKSNKMNGLYGGLPWKLSALGALVVLTAGMIAGLDPWVAIERAGIAFVGFWVVGSIGRLALGSSASHHGRSSGHSETVSKDQEHIGEVK